MNSRKDKMGPVDNSGGVAKPVFIKATQFQPVTFFDELQKRQVIVLYTLGEDGIVREFSGDKWRPFPITL